MPSKPLRPCTHASCPYPAVPGSSRCTEHQRAHWTEQAKQDKARRPEDKQFYDSAAWRKFRLFILRNEPYCRECKRSGRVALGTVVDHITRIRDGGAKLSAANTQVLCDMCHNAKRGRESHEGSMSK
jgi:5-methylcytosine-specific restriction protein A